MEVSIPKSIGMSRYMRPKVICNIIKNKTTSDFTKIFNKLKLNIEEIESCKNFMNDKIKGCKLSFNDNIINIGKKINSDELDDLFELWITHHKLCPQCYFPELKLNACSACGFNITT